MPSEPPLRTIRYETIIATLVGISALFVSGYTAYVQRQQVRATVWPILEFDSSNVPMIRFSLDNKGVGPAIVHRVMLKVNGQPMRNWKEALDHLVGPGKHRFAVSTMTGHVFSPGESTNVFIPLDEDAENLTREKGGDAWTQMNQVRDQVSVEICYGSTLGDHWLLRSDAKGTSTTEVDRCPDGSLAFQQ